MIRFACPGCQTAFTVGDEKGGKTGKCPKCGTAFSIPMPEPAAVAVSPPPPPPAPAADPNSPVEIAPCPKCGMALTVTTEYLGAEVECPGCQTVFKAVDKNARPPAEVKKPKLAPSSRDDDDDDRPRSKSKRRDDDDEDDRPVKKRSRRDDDDEDDDDRPVKKKSRRDDDDEDDRPRSKSKRRDDDDEDEDDRPRKKKKKRKSTQESKRMTAALLALLPAMFGINGIHKFYLGYTLVGIIYLFTGGLCGVGTLIDFIIYLTKSDEEFIETYQEGRKEWF